MSEIVVGQRSRRWPALAALAAGTLLISAMHNFTLPLHVHWHNVFQVLYYVPVVLAALLFGWRAGLAMGIIAAASHLPYIILASREAPDYAIEQAIELPLLAMVGSLTGVLSDRDR